MKKLLLVSLLLPLLVSCSGSAESPVIEITGFFIGDDTKDYSKDMASMPSLKVGDEMTVSLRLDGNGEDLNTFIVKEAAEQLGIKCRVVFLLNRICRSRRMALLRLKMGYTIPN